MDIEEIKNYVRANLAYIWEVRDIAVRFNVRADTFRKKFSRAEGIPLSKYIRQLRVAKAKELLEWTEKSCFEICYEVGFSREDSGQRTFKAEVGMTMNEYRTESRKKHPVVRYIRPAASVVSFNCP